MSSAERVYTFECNLAVAGKNLSVAAINVDMNIDAVPTIEFNVDPFHQKGQSPKQAFTPSLKHYFTGPIPKAIYGAVNKSEPSATFSLTAKSASDTQTIQCNGWVPVGAGYNEASSVNMAGFSVTIAHPLILAERSNRLVPYFGEFKNYRKAIIDGYPIPFLEFMIAAFDKRISNTASTSPDGVPTGTDPLVLLNERAKTALSNLTANLVWEPGKSNQYANPRAHTRACAVMVVQLFSTEVFTPLQAIVSMVCPNFFIRLAPDQKDLSKPMVLAPREPWGDVETVIEDKEISKLQPAPVSINQLSGVAITQSAFKDSEYAREYCAMNQFAIIEPQDAATKPDKYPSGPLKVVNMPGWLSDYASLVEDVPGTIGSNIGLDNKIEAEKKLLSKYFPLYSTVMRGYLKSQLQLLHYADKQVMVFTKLLLTKGGNLVRPGVVYEVNSGGPLCYFYCIKVRHRINVASAEAMTVLEGAYFRSTEGGSFEVTPAKGAKNPLFLDENKK